MKDPTIYNKAEYIPYVEKGNDQEYRSLYYSVMRHIRTLSVILYDCQNVIPNDLFEKLKHAEQILWDVSSFCFAVIMTNARLDELTKKQKKIKESII